MEKVKKNKRVSQKTKSSVKPVKKAGGSGGTKGKSSSIRATSGSVGVKKIYFKTKNFCKATFSLPKAAAPQGKKVFIVGDFNKWNTRANPMTKAKNGGYSVTLELERGREYQYRYLIDNSIWENDWKADKYVGNPFGDGDNSVVVIK